MLQSLQDKATAFLKDASSAVEQAVDFTAILSFVSSIITAIRGCTTQTTASERIKEGGPVAMVAALKIVKDSHPELRGLARRKKAAELVQSGKDLTADELADLMKQASDIPVESPPVGIWPVVLLLSCFLLFSAAAQAQDSPKGIWPIDEEQNARLDQLEQHNVALQAEVQKANASFQAVNNRLDNITEAIKSLNAPSAPAVIVPQEAHTPQKTVVGRDLRSLYAHPPAFMADSLGHTYNTTDQHLLDHGYTKAEIQGLTPSQKNALHGAAHAGHVPKSNGVLAANGGQTTITVSKPAQQYTYSTECNSRSCRRVRRIAGRG